jgi:hypothetical protein
MLLAYRLAGHSALEAHYAGVNALTQFGVPRPCQALRQMAPIGNCLARTGKRAVAVTLESTPGKGERPPVIEFILTFVALPIATLALWVAGCVAALAHLLTKEAS